MHLAQSLSLLLILLFLLLLLHALLARPLRLRLSRESLDLLRRQLRLELVLRQLVLAHTQDFLSDVECQVETLDLLTVLVLVVTF